MGIGIRNHALRKVFSSADQPEWNISSIVPLVVSFKVILMISRHIFTNQLVIDSNRLNKHMGRPLYASNNHRGNTL